MILIELAVAVVILLSSVCILNHNNMIPGTTNYLIEQRTREARMQEERARIGLITSRLRLRETENIDQLLLMPGSPVREVDGTHNQS